MISSKQLVDKHLPTFKKHFLNSKTTWVSLSPATKTVFKLLGIFIILAAIPITVKLSQMQLNYHSDAAVDCGTNLQVKIDTAPSGSILDLTGCYYTASATISKPLTLKGATLSVPASSNGLTVTADFVTIDGVHIIGPQAMTYNFNEKGIYTNTPVNNLTIKNSTVEKFGYGPTYLRYVNNLVIENNTFNDGVYTGIMVLSGQGGRISNNLIQRIGVNGADAHGNNAYGIALSRQTNSDPISKDFIIENNTITDVPTWHAIDTHAGQNLQFIGNKTYRASRAIFITSDSWDTPPANITIKNNLFGNPSPVTFNLTGITIYKVNGATITNNAISSGYGCATGSNTNNCVYDYTGQSINLVSTGNYVGESLPTQPGITATPTTKPTPTYTPTPTTRPTATPTPKPIATPTTKPTPTYTPTPTTRPTATPTPKPTNTPTPTPVSSSYLDIISGPTAGNIGNTTATITWYLSDYATGQVKYGKTSNYGLFSTAENSFNWNYHVQSLSGLSAGTTYHYAVMSKNASGNIVTSQDKTFTTLSQTLPPGQTKKCIRIIIWKFCF